MAIFKITYQMTMEVKANSEQEALEKFEAMTSAELGENADEVSVKRVEDTSEKHRIIDTSFGECCLKNETVDEDGYHWCDLYIGDNYDDYVGTCACGLDDDDDIILEQIEELLDY